MKIETETKAPEEKAPVAYVVLVDGRREGPKKLLQAVPLYEDEELVIDPWVRVVGVVPPSMCPALKAIGERL